jgi:hypothetical protein
MFSLFLYRMILIQVVCCSDSEMASESESSDKDSVSDNNCEGITLDESSDDDIGLNTVSEVKEGSNLGSNSE